jgi:hypothetical protein
LDQPDVDAEFIVRKSMKIAGDICVYTNHNILVEKLEPKPPLIASSSVSPEGNTSVIAAT